MRRPFHLAHVVLAAVICGLFICAGMSFSASPSADFGKDRGHNAFFRPPVNVSRSGAPSRFARTSPHSLALDPAGPIYLLWVEAVAHTKGVAHEVALCRYLFGSGWDSLLTPVGRWEGDPSTEPTAAIDNHHMLHIVWLDQSQAVRRVMGLRFDERSGELTDPTAVSEPGQSAADPAIAADPEGGVHVVWSEIDAGRPVLRYRRGDGSWWEPISTVPTQTSTEKSEGAFNPDVACDPGGSVHVVWIQNVSGASLPMYERRRASGEWEKPERLADIRPGWFAKPPVVCATEDRVWVAWAESDGKEARVVVRSRTSAGWSAPLIASRTAFIADQPSAAIDPWGTLHLVWIERSKKNPEESAGSGTGPGGSSGSTGSSTAVLYSSTTPSNLGFGPPRTLSPTGRGPFDGPLIGADASGRVVAAWVDLGSGGGDIVCRQGVAGFTPPTALLRYRPTAR